MSGLTIAAVGEEIDTGLLEHILAPQVSQIEFIDHAIEAIHNLKARPFPVIVASLRLAPGEHDPIMDPIMERMLPDYAEICCYMIRRLREEDSANKTTPIIVNSIVHPTDDKLFPNAEARVLRAGATEYSYLLRDGFHGLARSIRGHLQSQ